MFFAVARHYGLKRLRFERILTGMLQVWQHGDSSLCHLTRANKENIRGCGQHAQSGTQISSGQAGRCFFDSFGDCAVQVKAVNIRAAPVGISLIFEIFFAGDFQEAVPETPAVKEAAA
jgi:hypothetical protein